MKRLFVFAIVVINSAPIYSSQCTACTRPAPVTTTPFTPTTLIEVYPPVAPTKPIPASCDFPLYRLYHPTSSNHFYTTSLGEADNAANALGYTREGITGWVFPSTADCSCNDAYIPVYRLYKDGPKNDHFYTTSETEASNAAQNLQYKWEGVAFYCAIKQGDCRDCGSKVAVHRYNRNIDHFYTTSLSEGFQNVLPYGGTYEGILCYVWTK